MTDSSFVNVFGQVQRSPANNLMLDSSGYRVITTTPYNPLDIQPLYNSISNTLLSTEASKYSTTTPVNTGAFGPTFAQNHAGFGILYSGSFITYLKARTP